MKKGILFKSLVLMALMIVCNSNAVWAQLPPIQNDTIRLKSSNVTENFGPSLGSKATITINSDTIFHFGIDADTGFTLNHKYVFTELSEYYNYFVFGQGDWDYTVLLSGSYIIKVDADTWIAVAVVEGGKIYRIDVSATNYTVTAGANDGSMGQVTGSGKYKKGATATLTATPADGYHFVNWSNAVKDNPYSFVVTRDSALTANFVANDQRVEVKASNSPFAVVNKTYTASPSGYTGGMFYVNGGKLQGQEGVTFKDNKVIGDYGHGGAIYSSNGVNSFSGITNLFVNNSASKIGGAMVNLNKSTTSFGSQYTTFTGNSAHIAGAIANANGSYLTISGQDVLFEKNSADSYGAIYNSQNSKSYMSGSTITFNENSDNTAAGALYNEGETEFYGNVLTFSKNLSEQGAGAISNDGTLKTSGGSAIFTDNKSNYAGGAIFNNSGIMSINAGQFLAQNDSAKFGGAVLNNTGASFSVQCSTMEFNKNKASSFAGAVYNIGSMQFGGGELKFTNNLSLNNAGAVYNVGSIKASVGNLIFSGNYAENNEGALYNGNTMTLTGSTFTFANNSANNGYGGAIYNDEADTLIMEPSTSLLFQGNTAAYCGGMANSGIVNIKSKVMNFVGNTSGSYNGAIGNWGDITFTGNQLRFQGNVASGNEAGAVYNQGNMIFDVGDVAFMSNTCASPTNYYGFGGALTTSSGSKTVFKHNVLFQGNSISAEYGYGGAAFVMGNMTFEGATNFIANTSNYTGAVEVYDTLTFKGNAMFLNNVASDTDDGSYGGALSVDGLDAVVNLDDAQFNGNSADNGGAMYIYYGKVNMAGAVRLTTSSDDIGIQGGVLNWDLTNGLKKHGVLHGYENLWFWERGDGRLTITIDEHQEEGEYTIATGDFSNRYDFYTDTLYIKTADDSEGVKLAINGDKVWYGDMYLCQLKLESDYNVKSMGKRESPLSQRLVLVLESMTPPNDQVWARSNDGQKVQMTNPQNFNVKYLGSENIDGVTRFYFDGVIDRIGVAALKNCSNIQNLYLPKSVEYIAQDAFRDCKELVFVNIADSITRSIGPNAFEGCKKLQVVNIPNTVEEIDAFAFAYCESLEAITLPESVVRIYPNAFSYCSNLKSVNIKAKTMERLWTESFDKCHKDLVVYVPSSNLLDYEDMASARGLNIQTKITVNNVGNYYGTIYCHHNMIVPENVTLQAYIYDETYSGDHLCSTDEFTSGDVAPAGGYMVSLDDHSNSTEIETTSKTIDFMPQNDITGVLKETSAQTLFDAYPECQIFRQQPGTWDMSKQVTSADMINAYEALIIVDASGNALKLSATQATGVADVALESVETADADCYNTAGQKVARGYKGIVIKNGKKYLNR